MSDDLKQNKIICPFATKDNDGVTRHAIGDYSAIEGLFQIKPPANEIWHISRMLVHAETGGALVITKYGAVALTNGIYMQASNDDGIITDFTDGEPIKHLGDWAGSCFDLNLFPVGGAGDHAAVRWTFKKSGQYLRLEGAKNAKLELSFNDDLSPTGSNLLEHTFKFEGYIVNSQY